MVVDREADELRLKLVCYGPGLAGKTTNLHYVRERTEPERRTEMLTLATHETRLLTFELVPKGLARVAGMGVRFCLFAAPAAIFVEESRRRALDEADGVVFVADSQRERLRANQECLGDLASKLADYGTSTRELPFVLQYNKRELANAMSFDELEGLLNVPRAPAFSATARTAEGVFDTLKCVANMMVARARVHSAPIAPEI